MTSLSTSHFACFSRDQDTHMNDRF